MRWTWSTLTSRHSPRRRSRRPHLLLQQEAGAEGEKRLGLRHYILLCLPVSQSVTKKCTEEKSELTYHSISTSCQKLCVWFQMHLRTAMKESEYAVRLEVSNGNLHLQTAKAIEKAKEATNEAVKSAAETVQTAYDGTRGAFAMAAESAGTTVSAFILLVSRERYYKRFSTKQHRPKTRRRQRVRLLPRLHWRR